MPTGAFLCPRRAEGRFCTVRIVIALFWVSLLVGTLAAHNGVANWTVTLAGLYFAARRWAGRRHASRRAAAAAQPYTPNATPGHPDQRSAATAETAAGASCSFLEAFQ